MFRTKRCTILLVAALALLGACSKEEINNNLPGTEQQVPAPNIAAQVEVPSTTRAVIEDNDSYAEGEKFRWVENDQVLVQFTPTGGGDAVAIAYKVAKVNAETPKRCTFVPADAEATIAVGSYSVTGFTSYNAWSTLLQGGEDAVYTLPAQTQVGNQSSAHLSDNQLMASASTAVTITETVDDFSLSFGQQTSMMRFAITNDDSSLEGATVKGIALVSDKELFYTALTYAGGTLAGADPTTLLAMDVTDGAFNADNRFHGFMSMSPQTKTDINPEKLQVVITVTHGGIDYYLTATISGSDNVKLPNGFETGKSYYFNLRLSKLTKTPTVLVTTAVGQIAADPSLIDQHLSPFGTLIVRGPVSDADIAAIGTRMKEGLVIKEIDLSGTTEVTTIPKISFYRCTSLNSILLPPSITEIIEGAFESCTALKEIVIPENVEVIDNSAFYDCSNLATVNLPTSMTNGTLGTLAFARTALKSITIPSGITTIPEFCFLSCDQLESVTLPKGLEEIEMGAFYYCSQLSAITLPASVTVVRYEAFTYSGITSIIVEGILPAKDGGSGTTTTAVNGYLVINNTMSSRSHNLFLPNIKKLSVALTYKINEYSTVYYNYTGTGDRTDPANYDSAAGYNVLVTTATGQIAANPTLIDTYLCEDGTLIVQGPVNTDDIAAIGTRVKDTTKATIKAIDLEGTTGLTEIPDKAFYECKTLESIILPESVESIGEQVFLLNSGLTSITMPTSMTGTIGESAFAGCISLQNIVIPSGITTIPDGCFSSCTSLKSVTLPEGVEVIGKQSFYECNSLETITLPTSVAVVGYRAFSRGTGTGANILIEGTKTAVNGGSTSTTTGQTGYLVINSMMNYNVKSKLLLPNITNPFLAATYDAIHATRIAVYFNYTGGTDGDRFDVANYTLYDPAKHGSGGDNLEGGGGFDL